MKKIFLIIISFFVSITICTAKDYYFYLGEKVPDIHIIMDKAGDKVYRQFRMIYSSDTNELVYCIEPGTVLSTGAYKAYSTYNSSFNLSRETLDKIKLYGYFGYGYGNHTDIKWYAITQYLIWKETLPVGWDLYFTDTNKNRINLFENEINEINTYIKNFVKRPNITSKYTFNYNDDIIIYDSNNLLNNYTNNSFLFSDSSIKMIGNQKFSDYSYSLINKNYISPLFYYNSDGQNIFTKGSVMDETINFSIHITSGSLKINECDQETFLNTVNNGTYDILDGDANVIDSITCDSEECLIEKLPIGHFSIKVNNLPDEFEENNYIYDFEIKDNNETSVDICSLKKKTNITQNIEVNNNTSITTNNTLNNNISDNDIITNNYKKDIVVINNINTTINSNNSVTSNVYSESSNEVSKGIEDDTNLLNNNNIMSMDVVDVPYTSSSNNLVYYIVIIIVALGMIII